MGNTNLLQPLQFKRIAQSDLASNTFITVKNLPALQQTLSRARSEQKPVLVDFYAD